jgi:hypothetical protein
MFEGNWYRGPEIIDLLVGDKRKRTVMIKVDPNDLTKIWFIHPDTNVPVELKSRSRGWPPSGESPSTSTGLPSPCSGMTPTSSRAKRVSKKLTGSSPQFMSSAPGAMAWPIGASRPSTWTGFGSAPRHTPLKRRPTSGGGVCVVVEGQALHALNVWLHKNGERLIAQVHSHPTHAFHSPMDDDYAVVTKPGSLSLVVPDFAVRPFSVGDCAIFRLSGQGKWIEVKLASAHRLISVPTEGASDAS